MNSHGLIRVCHLRLGERQSLKEILVQNAIILRFRDYLQVVTVVDTDWTVGSWIMSRVSVDHKLFSKNVSSGRVIKTQKKEIHQSSVLNFITVYRHPHIPVDDKRLVYHSDLL